jgi:hypothetical protein
VPVHETDKKKFTLSDLLPGKEYKVTVRAFNEKGRGIGRSAEMRIKTATKNVAPPPVTNLVANFEGATFVATWDGSAAMAESDFFRFKIIITSALDPLLEKYFYTGGEEFSLTRDEMIMNLGGAFNQLTITVISVDRTYLESEPVSASSTNLPPADPENVEVVAENFGYSVSWTPPGESDYSHSRIYESETLVDGYSEVAVATATPARVRVVGFEPRYVKVSHVDQGNAESGMVLADGSPVTPTSPVVVDITAPGPVTNAAAAFSGTDYTLSFDKPTDTDLRDFIITLVGSKVEPGDPTLLETISKMLVVSATNVSLQSLTMSLQENIDFFGQAKNNIVATVSARDIAGNIGTSVANISASFTDSIPAPTGVLAEPGLFRYDVSWDQPTYELYSYSELHEASSSGGTFTHIETGISPISVNIDSTDTRWIKVKHVTVFGTKSVFSDEVQVTPTNTISVDTILPSQRTSIVYTPAAESVVVSWGNPSTLPQNGDVAGITIRYALESSPSDYTWVKVPFTYDSPLTSATISGLLPLTKYWFSIATYDVVQNTTPYSTEVEVETDRDEVAPARPVAPVVTAGASAGGPMTVIVSQEAREHGTVSTPLALDTSLFRVFMLEQGFTTAPATGVSTNSNTVEVGTIEAAFNGGTAQNKFYIPIPEGETRYFYVRAVDTSGNVSDASEATQSSAMLVLDSAYISSLTADKIATGTLQAGRSIKVGTTSSQINIESDTTGKIYSGTFGQYNNSNTSLYMDTDGKFSLKNRLAFDGTNLSIVGDVSATGGNFSGNVQLSNGSLYAGKIVTTATAASLTGGAAAIAFASEHPFTLGEWIVVDGSIAEYNGVHEITYVEPTLIVFLKSNPDIAYSAFTGTVTSARRLIFNSNGISGYDDTNSNKFNITTSGLLTAKSGTVGGWTIEDSIIRTNQLGLHSKTTTPVGISTATWSSGTVTYNTSTPHNLVANDYVAVSGVASSTYNGVFKVLAAPSTTQFTVSRAGSSASSSGGTAAAVPMLRAGDVNSLFIGADVGGSGKNGLIIDANDYIYGDGTFSLGNGQITWNGSLLSITGSASFTGTVNASGGSFNGNVRIIGGSVSAGADPQNLLPGAMGRVVMTPTGIAAYNQAGTETFTVSTSGVVSLGGEGILTVGSSLNGNNITSIDGAKITTGRINSGSPNAYVAPAGGESVGTFATTGFSINLTGGDIIAKALRIKADGNAWFGGTLNAVTGSMQSMSLSGSGIPAVGLTVSDGSNIKFLRKVGTDDSSMLEWHNEGSPDTYVRSKLGFVASGIPTNSHLQAQALNLISYPSSSLNSAAHVMIKASDAISGGTSTVAQSRITLSSSQLWAPSVYSDGLGAGAKIMAIRSDGRIGTATATELSITAGYENATGGAASNRVTYGTGNPVTVGATANGDLHFKY